MWEHIRKEVSDPTSILNTSLSETSPRTGMKFRVAASKRARDPKISDKTGATYADLGPQTAGAQYNAKGEYRVSTAEKRRIAQDNTARLRMQDAKRRREDAIIRELLAEQDALMAEYDRRRMI